MMTNFYQDIDFYENTIRLLTNGFVSPLSPISPNIYRFYIQDTTVIDGKSMIHLYFAPRTKTDFAFMGHMWIANDTTYALHKIEAGIPNDINLNWVRELQISQKYDWVANRADRDEPKLMLVKEDIMIDFGLSKGDSTRSVLGRKSTSFQHIDVNRPLSDTLFNFAGPTIRAYDGLRKPHRADSRLVGHHRSRAAVGESVLVIDLDPQGNASTGLGIDRQPNQKSSYHVLIGEAELADVIKDSGIPNLHCAPATIDLLGAELELAEFDRKTYRLQDAIKRMTTGGRAYSYILVDCPPSLNLLTINSLAAADAILVPLQCEFFALEGSASFSRRLNASRPR